MLNNELAVKVEMAIQASAERVWNALTQPEIIKQYMYGTQAICDWKVGSSLIFKGEWEGKSYEDKGIIQIIEPNKQLQYTYWSGWYGLPELPENHSLITYDIVQKDDKTLLTLSQIGFVCEENRQHAVTGWSDCLNQLKNLLEK